MIHRFTLSGLVALGALGWGTLSSPEASRDVWYGDITASVAIDGGAIMYALDGGRTEGAEIDGVADAVFYLQTQADLTDFESFSIEDATVTLGPNFTLIEGGGAHWVLSVGAVPGDAGDTPGSVLVGFGFGHRIGQFSLQPDSDGLVEAFVLRCAPGTTCDSGGPGSSSCSTSCRGGGECEVTCVTPNYSCCDKINCTCTSVEPE